MPDCRGEDEVEPSKLKNMPDRHHGPSEPSAITTLVVNGQSFALDALATVASLVDLRQPRPPFAVELNKRLVRRSEYANTPLANGDNLEIVTLVGGG